MIDEERQEETEETPEAPDTAAEAPAEEPVAEEPEAPETEPAEDPAEPDAPAEDSAGIDVAEGEDSGEAAQAAAAGSGVSPEAEPEAPVGPKAKRKMERSRASGTALPPRTPEERAAERAERRAAAKVRRRRYRAGRKAKRGEAGQGTPPAERTGAVQKTRQGTVVSSKANKTITVQVEIVRRHPRYEKVVRRSHTVHAHDEQNEANEGDLVRLIESRPISRSKRWRLEQILQRAPARTPGVEPAEEPEVVEVGAAPSPIDLAEAAAESSGGES